MNSGIGVYIWKRLEIAGAIVLGIVTFFTALYNFLKFYKRLKEKDIVESQQVLENKETGLENRKQIRSISGEVRILQDDVKDLSNEIKLTQTNLGNLQNCVSGNTIAIKELRSDNAERDQKMKEFIAKQNKILLTAIKDGI